jgi:hypothetical protein
MKCVALATLPSLIPFVSLISLQTAINPLLRLSYIYLKESVHKLLMLAVTAYKINDKFLINFFKVSTFRKLRLTAEGIRDADHATPSTHKSRH